MLTLHFGDNEEMQFQNNHLLRHYILAGSEEEEHFIASIFADLPNWNAEDPALHTQQFIDSCCITWDKFSKPGKAQFNHWWNKNCSAAKSAYDNMPTQPN